MRGRLARAGIRRTWLTSVALGTAALGCVSGQQAASAQAEPRSPAAGSAGLISTVAGGPGGPARATLVPFSSPHACGTVQYSGGYLYIADQAGDIVRAVRTRTGWLSTAAGVGQAGSAGDGGPASAAELAAPCAATTDYAGNLVIADKGNGRVRVVAAKSGTFYGQAMTAGDIYTVLRGGAGCRVADGSGSFCPVDVIADRHGNVLVSSEGTEAPRGHPVAQLLLLAARTGTFYGKKMTAGKHYLLADGAGAQIAIDHAGNIIAARGTRVTVLAEQAGRFYGQAMKPGHGYVVAGSGKAGSSGDGGPARAASLDEATGVAVDHAGNIVIGDSAAGQIRVVAVRDGRFYGLHMKAGDIYLIAGHAEIDAPHSVAIDGSGNVVFCDGGNLARVIAVKAGLFYGLPMKAGRIYTVAGNRPPVPFAADAGPATSAQGVSGGIAIDAGGNLLIAAGTLRVAAAATGTFYGTPMTAGHIYTIAGGATTGGFGDGGPALDARLGPADVAVDAAGNLVVTDQDYELIRVIAAQAGTYYGQAMTAGDIYTVAGDGTPGYAGDGGPATSAEIYNPQGVAIDQAGNLVFIDVDNARVRVVAAATGTYYGHAMTAGDIYTIAGDGNCGFAGDGGQASSAEFCFTSPDAITIDAAGNLVIADSGNFRVRVIAAGSGTFYGTAMTAGDIYTVAGSGHEGSSGNGGPALSADLRFPEGVAVDGHGNLVIGDSGSNEIRVVAAASGTFYGVAMTAGDIYRVAGQRALGMTGDGGPALSAELASPDWVTLDGSGNLIVADDRNGRIRMVGG